MLCKIHLPRKDTTIILEDESEHQFQVKYYADKTGLSAGWRQFCTTHNLLEGDVLLFQLVEPTKFKVYIIRANDLTELDGALGLLNLDAHTKQSDSGRLIDVYVWYLKFRSCMSAVVQKKNKRSGLQRLACNIGQPAEQSENDSEEVGSEVLEGFKLLVPTIKFKDITNFENFNILVDGLVINSELSEDIPNKYYRLCCSQNSFLHENIIQDLKAFELLGMNVGFLRTRLRLLVNLAFESEGAAETRWYIEAKMERAQTEDEIRNLEAKLAELKDSCKTFGVEIESLQSEAETYEFRFEEEVKDPW
ncbi:hypothetical protein CRYUN_Cryun22dG0099300 [Craigia yunnanensis]